jgi:hypothetical protein
VLDGDPLAVEVVLAGVEEVEGVPGLRQQRTNAVPR